MNAFIDFVSNVFSKSPFDGLSSQMPLWVALGTWTILALGWIALFIWPKVRRLTVHPWVKVSNGRALVMLLPVVMCLSQWAWFSLGWQQQEVVISAPVVRQNEALVLSGYLPQKGGAVSTEPISDQTVWTFLPDSKMTLLWWICLAAWGFGFMRLGRDWLALARYRRHLDVMDTANSPRLMETLDRMAFEVGVDSPKIRCVVANESVPMTFGWIKPVVVVPFSLLKDQSALEMAMMHELVHIRRKDYLWSEIGRIVGVICWFHPLIWVLNRHIKQECEKVCDAVVLTTKRFSVSEYAQLLFQLSRTNPTSSALLMADTYEHLKTRFESMKQIKHSSQTIRKARFGALLGTFGLVACLFVAVAGSKVEQHFVMDQGKSSGHSILEAPNMVTNGGIEGRNIGEEMKEAKGIGVIEKINPKVVNLQPQASLVENKGGMPLPSIADNRAQNEDYVFQLEIIKVNGEVIHKRTFNVPSWRSQWSIGSGPIPHVGALTFRNFKGEVDGAVLADIKGNILKFQVEGKTFELESETLILPTSSKPPIWVKWQSEEAYNAEQDAIARESSGFRFQPVKITIDNVDVTANVGGSVGNDSISSSYVTTRMPQMERILFSGKPFLTAEQNGVISGKHLIFKWEGKTVDIECARDIEEGQGEINIWLIINPSRNEMKTIFPPWGKTELEKEKEFDDLMRSDRTIIGRTD
jgi:beta-lactamase regulating signal transducer with metallopeptidase domain